METLRLTLNFPLFGLGVLILPFCDELLKKYKLYIDVNVRKLMGLEWRNLVK